MSFDDGPIVIVANRGPNDFVLDNGAWVARPAAGGLVSMLAPLAHQPNVHWVCCVSEPPGARHARRGLFTTAVDQTDPELDLVPVPLPADVYQAYYGQISNEVLWMLQHRLVDPSGLEYLDQRRHHAWNDGYLEANSRIAAAIAERIPRPGAFLVQDYHLYPLPALLRRQTPNCPILHFTHIPFPEPSMLKLLPRSWRETILRGLLGADVVGLQTVQDVRAFLACCAELPGVTVDLRRSTVLTDQERAVLTRVYPASVDPAALRATMRSATVEAARHRLASELGHLSIVRVDRLDPSKNQVLGFLAFGRLLELRPDLRGRLRFLAFLVPSRTDLRIYRAYRDSVYRAIERVNARFRAECGGDPIRVFYTNDRDQALAAMERCDVLLVNSLADGMNLVVKEWAVVSTRPGSLVVSETTGVAGEVADCALPVSPLDVEGTAHAMAQALDLPPGVREVRLNRLRTRVEQWTAADWLSAQLAELGQNAVADPAPPVLR